MIQEKTIVWFNRIRELLSKRLPLSIGGIALLFISIKLFNYAVLEREMDDPSFQKLFNEHYRIFSLNLPASASFAEEKVPLELIDVREKFDRELMVNTYWQSNTLLYHKRANRYFPVIEPILKAYGVPDDFKYLAVIESGLENVVSPAGAAGFWQLMKGSAQEYGLEVNDKIDERYNLKKSTEAACRYLKDSYKTFGSWTMAAASYNLGKSGLYKQLQRQRANNYYDLLLNSETGRYVYRILAVKEILNNSTKYGYYYRKSDLYPPIPTRSVAVDSTINDLAAFAKMQGINYKILKMVNPWLRDNVLPNKSAKTYQIEIPNGELRDLKPLDLGEFTAPVNTDKNANGTDTTLAE
ncbi:MAG TPA: lytic transglycosylase domain-containing protein [Luteibaculaceae bacterium]|nr:lytic transglycosylase domain-containing protein [Luteibaculaceae bacterium]